MTNKNTRILFSFLASAIISLGAQQGYSQNKQPLTEDDKMQAQADEFFKAKKYSDAYPIYSQLLSNYSSDPGYNYHFAVCMLYLKTDKEKPIRCLEKAVKSETIDRLAFYYLGWAYQLNYRFKEAIEAYQKFKMIATSSELESYPVDHSITDCNNGIQQLNNFYNLDVLRKKELGVTNFQYAYPVQEIGGSLVREPDDLKSSEDRKHNFTSLIFSSHDKKYIFFTSYGESSKNGKDIYMMKKQDDDGTWGKAENLGPVINTAFDEDYPYFDSKNKILYFSSAGHNSLGGYDVFKSHYDETSNTWTEPENLNFPINSPDDDFLFIPDSSGQTAYFSSTRSSPQGFVDVYKVANYQHEPQMAGKSNVPTDSLSNYANKVARMDVNVDTTKVILRRPPPAPIAVQPIKDTKPVTPKVDTISKSKSTSPQVVANTVVLTKPVALAPKTDSIPKVKPTSSNIVDNSLDRELDEDDKVTLSASSETASSSANIIPAPAPVVVKKDTVKPIIPDKKVIESSPEPVVHKTIDSVSEENTTNTHSLNVRRKYYFGNIRSVAGNGKSGFSGDGDLAAKAMMDTANGVAVDDSLNVYIADSQNNRIRKVYAKTGKIVTIAGIGTRGYSGDGKTADKAELFYPTGIKVDAVHNIYFSDAGNVVVRKIAAKTNIITTVVGDGLPGYLGDGDTCTHTRLLYPVGLAVTDSGDIFIADAANNAIRKLNRKTGIVSTFAGNHKKGYTGDGGPANKASLNSPYGVALDKSGNVYIADGNNNVIRKVNKYGIISTFAGTGKSGYNGDSVNLKKIEFGSPAGICTDNSGNLYVMDPGNARVLFFSVSNNMGYTVAGSKENGFSGDGGRASRASLHYPFDVAVDKQGSIYILDVLNFRIRKVVRR